MLIILNDLHGSTVCLFFLIYILFKKDINEPLSNVYKLDAYIQYFIIIIIGTTLVCIVKNINDHRKNDGINNSMFLLFI